MRKSRQDLQVACTDLMIIFTNCKEFPLEDKAAVPGNTKGFVLVTNSSQVSMQTIDWNGFQTTLKWVYNNLISLIY